MTKKTKKILVAGACALVALALAAYGAAGLQNQQASASGEMGSASADAETSDETSSPNMASWVAQADSDEAKVINKLCMSRWKSTDSKTLVSLEMDGTGTVRTDGSSDVDEVEWSLTDFAAGSSTTGSSSTTASAQAVITVDGESYQLTYYQEVTAAAVTDTIVTNAFANGSPLSPTDKEGAFTLYGADSDLSKLIADSDKLESRMKSSLSSTVPLATSATWDREAELDYSKRTYATTFTCNNSKQTTVYVVGSLDSGEIYGISLSKSAS